MSDTRPCKGCNKGSPYEGPYDVATQCRICWLFENDASYTAMWTGEPLPVVATLMQPKIDKDCVKRKNEPSGFNTVNQSEPMKPQYPPRVTQAANFVSATTEWVKAGRPERTEEEQKRIHTICESCEFFDVKQDRCTKCGCGLSSSASTNWIFLIGIPDAIKMETHHCPINKW